MKSFPRQPRIPRPVALRRKMLTTVNFDNEFLSETDKIQNETFDRGLSTEFETHEAAMAQ